MFLARVKGHVVATAKDPSIKGRKLLIVEPLKVDFRRNRRSGAVRHSRSHRAGVPFDDGNVERSLRGVVDDQLRRGILLEFLPLNIDRNRISPDRKPRRQ